MTKPAHTLNQSNKSFQSVLVIVVGLVLCYARYKQPSLLYAAIFIGVGSLVSGLFRQGLLWIWNMLALVLGWINSRILLSLVFYLFLFPVALIYRMKAKNPLLLKKTNASMYISRNHRYTASDIENAW